MKVRTRGVQTRPPDPPDRRGEGKGKGGGKGKEEESCKANQMEMRICGWMDRWNDGDV